mgnify:CR=1 FL=1
MEGIVNEMSTFSSIVCYNIAKRCYFNLKKLINIKKRFMMVYTMVPGLKGRYHQVLKAAIHVINLDMQIS